MKLASAISNSRLGRRIPKELLDTAFIRAFGWIKIPMIAFVQPKVVANTDEMIAVEIPLNRLTRNHQGSLYVGALAIGADLAAAYQAVREIKLNDLEMSYIFKEMSAQFFKRCSGNVRFTCSQGHEVKRAIAESVATGERVNLPLKVVATVPSSGSDEPVAEFVMTLSLKPTKD